MSDPFELSKSVARGLGIIRYGAGNPMTRQTAIPQQAKPFGQRATAAIKAGRGPFGNEPAKVRRYQRPQG